MGNIILTRLHPWRAHYCVEVGAGLETPETPRLSTDLNGPNETSEGSAGIFFDVCRQIVYDMNNDLGGNAAENCRRTPHRGQNRDSGSTEPCHPLRYFTVTFVTGSLHLIFLNQKPFRVCHFFVLLFSCFVSVVC